MILPMVAVVAVLDPLTAANRVQPPTLQCRRRPGIGSTQGERPRNRRSEMSLRNTISPMTMKMGTAASSQVLAVRHIVPIMIAPTRLTGMSRRSTRAEALTIISATKIHVPSPR